MIYLVSINNPGGGNMYFNRLEKMLVTDNIHYCRLILPKYFEFFGFLIPVYLFFKGVKFNKGDTIISNMYHAHYIFFTKTRNIYLIFHDIFNEKYISYKSKMQHILHKLYFRPAQKKCLKLATDVITISQFTYDDICKNFGGYFDVSKMQVIYPGVDTELFIEKEVDWGLIQKANSNIDFSRFEGKTKLFYCGNGTVRKGFDLLPQIMNLLGSNYVLFYTSSFRSHNHFSISKNMVKVELPCTDSLVDFYSYVDALLFPSRMEGFGYVICEALACNTPVITTNYSAMTEIVINGKNGWLCEFSDVEDFTAKVQKISQLDASSGNAYISEKFSLKTMSESIIKFLLVK